MKKSEAALLRERFVAAYAGNAAEAALAAGYGEKNARGPAPGS
jgi:phage terminase small subunit